MAWAWYNVLNLNDFEKKGIPQTEIEVDMEGIGLQKILVFKKNFINVIFKETVLTPKMNDRNGFEKNGLSAYIDLENNLWVGFNEDNM